jgi:hypothetical protein
VSSQNTDNTFLITCLKINYRLKYRKASEERCTTVVIWKPEIGFGCHYSPALSKYSYLFAEAVDFLSAQFKTAVM